MRLSNGRMRSRSRSGNARLHFTGPLAKGETVQVACDDILQREKFGVVGRGERQR